LQKRKDKKLKIAIGNDHAAVQMKKDISKYLEEKGYEIINFGTDTDESVDYPLYGQRVAEAVKAGKADVGVLICGTGIGISLAANKVPGIRAAAVSEPVSARLAREHNNANIIAFGARIVGLEEAKAIVDAFLGAEFLGGRHSKRVSMIEDIEKKYNK
jgi:ribose 5-phosphate isomerase B